VDSRAGLDIVEKIKIYCTCRKSNPGRPDRSSTLYWLSYPRHLPGGNEEIQKLASCFNSYKGSHTARHRYCGNFIYKSLFVFVRDKESLISHTHVCVSYYRYSDWLRADRLRDQSSSPGRGKNFLYSTASGPALGPTQPSIQWVPGVKRPGREADHSPPTNAEVKKTWIYTSTPPCAFMAWCLIS
jgi:hypothetical protein